MPRPGNRNSSARLDGKRTSGTAAATDTRLRLPPSLFGKLGACGCQRMVRTWSQRTIPKNVTPVTNRTSLGLSFHIVV